MPNQIQPYRRKNAITGYSRSNVSQHDGLPVYRPLVCSHCAARNVRPFATIYGRGTTYYTRLKGLVLKHGYEKTKRQSVMASKFSPPLKLPWSPFVLAMLMCFGARWAAAHLENYANYSYMFLVAGYYLGWCAVLIGVGTGVNNFGFYPPRLAIWTSSYYCEKCGRVSILGDNAGASRN